MLRNVKVRERDVGSGRERKKREREKSEYIVGPEEDSSEEELQHSYVSRDQFSCVALI